MNRRDALKSLGLIAVGGVAGIQDAKAETLIGYPAETAVDPNYLPTAAPVNGPFVVLTDEPSRRVAAAIFDRLIPGDELGPSASEAGAIEYLDAQLAGKFGNATNLYRSAPLQTTEEKMAQVPQFISTPRERYEAGLEAVNSYAKQNFGAGFADLSSDAQDKILAGMESGSVKLANVEAAALFEMMLQNAREAYFADPIYGGNKDMVGWKMIGFPGARYDYRLYVDRIGQELDLEPVSLVPAN